MGDAPTGGGVADVKRHVFDELLQLLRRHRRPAGTDLLHFGGVVGGAYHESGFPGRPLAREEARAATNTVRRPAALLLPQPKVDANYHAVKAAAFAWPPAWGVCGS